jgi:N utilization substance protein B
MALSAQKRREIVFQLLYSQGFASPEIGEIAELIMPTQAVTKKGVCEAFTQVQSILEKKEALDTLIRGSSEAYAFERISSVELSVLRLGLYELLFTPGMPPKVAISEAMRLCRKYATREGSAFVNAILDHHAASLPTPA